MPDFSPFILLSTVTSISGRTSILSGIVMLLSLAALRMICSASATLPLAFSHTPDSGRSLQVSDTTYSLLACCERSGGAETAYATFQTDTIKWVSTMCPCILSGGICIKNWCVALCGTHLRLIHDSGSFSHCIIHYRVSFIERTILACDSIYADRAIWYHPSVSPSVCVCLSVTRVDRGSVKNGWS